MGAKVDFTSHIKISGKTNANGLLRTYGYYDLTDEMISQITNTPTIKFVQISEPLPQQAYIAIDKILEKARKHIEHIAELESLENLTVRGIKLKNFDFLRWNGLRSLSIHLCSMNDLTSLTGFDSLKSLELWRIARLEDISFIAILTGSEHLCLRDLKHITTLPDLSAPERLQEIILDNVPIDAAAIPADCKAPALQMLAL